MRIAIYPGSFDPITNGHMDVIKRASKLFDKVIVTVMFNSQKPNTSFSGQERVDLISRCIKDLNNVEVDIYFGLLANYVKAKGACTVIKGLRAVSDFEYEFQQTLTNKKLNPDFETVFIPANAEHMFLSSSVVKQVCKFEDACIHDFVPPEILADVRMRVTEIESR